MQGDQHQQGSLLHQQRRAHGESCFHGLVVKLIFFLVSIFLLFIHPGRRWLWGQQSQSYKQIAEGHTCGSGTGASRLPSSASRVLQSFSSPIVSSSSLLLLTWTALAFPAAFETSCTQSAVLAATDDTSCRRCRLNVFAAGVGVGRATSRRAFLAACDACWFSLSVRASTRRRLEVDRVCMVDYTGR
ncbi:hypothetical protein DFH08DRAFT_839524 [Mycena albidolilacea]|uniref:Transmembrane protein n=1 Tax=Mycena albidolilacea TaxID=1033008 RepID=A0AAD7APH9_9AGAR|nr:hypothetical protein DFH08DRAFT_839524 [Mycena albidolilacea]